MYGQDQPGQLIELIQRTGFSRYLAAEPPADGSSAAVAQTFYSWGQWATLLKRTRDANCYLLWTRFVGEAVRQQRIVGSQFHRRDGPASFPISYTSTFSHR